ncbi:MAG TPA: DUF3551 domain-containing protein [Xanthobacteraceae bacterium]|nr:DUF3551 domain-containing protein [Xanthobacteraceae bacterium]
MKAAILLGTAMALATATFSEAAPRANERYCIEMAEAGGPAGPPQCMFETLTQCIASKTAPNDRCMENPWFAARGNR